MPSICLTLSLPNFFLYLLPLLDLLVSTALHRKDLLLQGTYPLEVILLLLLEDKLATQQSADLLDVTLHQILLLLHCIAGNVAHSVRWWLLSLLGLIDLRLRVAFRRILC